MRTSLGVHDEGGPVAVLEGLKRRKWRGLGAYKGLDAHGCVEAFVEGRHPCRAASIRSDGTKLWSYFTVIGEWVSDKTIEINCAKYSVTTSKHQSWLRSAAASAPGVTIRCKNEPMSPATRRRMRQRHVP